MNDQNRIQIFGVPVDDIDEERFGETIRRLATDNGKHQIVFLDFRGLMRARGKGEYADMIRTASLVVPTSKSILAGARFLKLPVPHRHNPFAFVIKLLGAIEQIGGTLYLVGSRPDALQKAFGNVRDSFPGLRLVGRYAGYFRKDIERDVITAIKKAGPTILLAGDGLKGKALWLKRHERSFGFGISLFCDGCFKIFSGKRQRISNKSWERNSWWIPAVIIRPWRWFSFLRYILYGILLFIEKMRRRNL
ncbi:WecB/TagA/CpsF family glycosyltransferase [Sediminispirochaeta smaragdinae]|uniref:Glycosyl transferase, WecB/TagA/CpsF family n=1 Tax=Sediminispirochaeta smaragdinae (strain DSM 11293 / JCM 15392 / SEBR 4228) TaxID=573413 RepID=E1R8G3_SEDSS|nr:WecB/TagA/CpsF family glycosyltransferase [Sediminispirochaeta smaragdinae]ADK79307.1 glycosyl transferase, WecB/TagA/CpsF family [Sediminispirochaeta smaragdinae DSM 11293]